MLGGVAAGWCDRAVAMRALTDGPARILRVTPRADDWIAIDLEATWTPRASDLATLGKNTPLLGRPLRGRVAVAVVGGETRFEVGEHAEAR